MNEQRLADALQDCLERIEAGQTSAQALARHPELRAELAPRLRAALTVRAWSPGPTPAFGPALRRRLAEVDAERSRSPRILDLARWQAPLLRVAALLLAAGLALGTASYAAASILPPDHWLQPLVTRIERVRQGLVDSAQHLLPGLERDAAPAPPAPVDALAQAPLAVGPADGLGSAAERDPGPADPSGSSLADRRWSRPTAPPPPGTAGRSRRTPPRTSPASRSGPAPTCGR